MTMDEAELIRCREALHARGLPADNIPDDAALAVLAAMEAPTTLFVVTAGEYSRYHIEGIFSTREGAQDYVDQAGPGDIRGIEEYTLDAMVGWEMGPVWECLIDLNDGDILGEYRRPRDGLRHPTAAVCPGAPSFRDGRPYLRVTSPTSAAHARKVAVERRQEWLRKWASEGHPA